MIYPYLQIVKNYTTQRINLDLNNNNSTNKCVW